MLYAKMKLWSTNPQILTVLQLLNGTDYDLSSWADTAELKENRALAKGEIERRKAEAELKREEAYAKK
jgi:hypothetical protein